MSDAERVKFALARFMLMCIGVESAEGRGIDRAEAESRITEWVSADEAMALLDEHGVSDKAIADSISALNDLLLARLPKHELS